MEHRKTPQNSYFQTALLDPTSKPTPRSKLPHHALASPLSTSQPRTLTLIIGPPSTQRQWIFPISLLFEHSTLIASHIHVNPTSSTLHLPNISPTDFANYASYLHSSIYTLNEKVANFRGIRHHTQACLLGIHLGDKSYTNAAMRTLYMIFEPLACLRTSNARKSPIRASDVDFVCEMTTTSATSTSSSSGNTGLGLRTLFFDALSSHWTQHELMNIGPRVDFPGDTVSWIDVYNSYPDFRAALARGMIVRGLNAGCVLGRMEGYVGMNWGWRKEDVGVNVRMDGKLGNEDGDGSWADGLIARPLPDVPVETAGDDAEEEHRSEEDGSEDDEDERVPWIDVAESFRADSDEDMEDGLD